MESRIIITAVTTCILSFDHNDSATSRYVQLRFKFLYKKFNIVRCVGGAYVIHILQVIHVHEAKILFTNIEIKTKYFVHSRFTSSMHRALVFAS